MVGAFRFSIILLSLLHCAGALVDAQDNLESESSRSEKEGAQRSAVAPSSGYRKYDSESGLPLGTCRVDVHVVDAHREAAGDRSPKKRALIAEDAPMAGSNNKMKLVKSFANSLGKMDYRDFSEQQNLTQVVRMGEETKFTINIEKQEQHSLSVVPLSVRNGMVNFTVSWLDEQGKEVFASKMRVADGKELSLGAEHARDYSTVVRLGFVCHP